MILVLLKNQQLHVQVLLELVQINFYSSKYFIAAFSAHKKSILIKSFQIILEHC